MTDQNGRTVRTVHPRGPKLGNTRGFSFCRLDLDSAWQPPKEQGVKTLSPIVQVLYKFVYGSPLKCGLSLAWWSWHFHLHDYPKHLRSQVRTPWLLFPYYSSGKRQQNFA